TTLFVAVVLFTTSMNAQLSNFSLEVTKTDETCQGNGSLAFAVSNITPNAAILYKVYLLPDTNNPIAILNENTLGSLTAGTYKVVALQSLGSLLNSKEQNVTIASNIQPFNFSISAQGLGCAGGGTIIVNTVTGIASTYEIISGPVTRPLQSSNAFAGLPTGSYNIRAFNNCGVGKVKTFNLNVVSSALSISEGVYSDGGVECDSITVNNMIMPTEGTINYPINVRYRLSPMTLGGNEIVINQVFATGSPDSLAVSAVVPRLDEAYDYDITVTDNCNTVYERIGDVIDPAIGLALSTGNAPCAEKFLVITASKYTAWYTVNFISAPAGFDPSAYNTGGPYTDATVNYGGENTPVPFGNYVVEITDSCGRKTTESLLIEFEKPIPSATGNNNGCFSEFGRIRVSVPQQKIVAATIIAAPATYTQTLPQNVNANISTAGRVTLNNMPLGMYTVIFTDDCGFDYEKEVEVPPYVEKEFNIATLPGCETGLGTVRVRSGNGDLESAVITAAPSGFAFALPYDVTATINEGDLYMSSLPEGTYTFRATDVCGVVKDQTINVEGYRPPVNSYVFTPNCGGFSVKVTDGSNGLEGSVYWLQKYNPATGSWGHPGNNTAYAEGEAPTTTNSIRLTNNATRNNLNYFGKFRIIKKFETFANGSSENTICLSILGEFDFTEAFTINAAYSLACLGQANDIMLDVTGYPVAYRIVEKNNVPFTVNNATGNVFTNLEPAEYMFEIEDACGNIVKKRLNVQSLPSMAEANNPGDMIICAESGTVQNHEFRLTDQNPAVLGPLHSSMYTISYHLTQQDANDGVNALPEYYTNIANGQQIFVRLVHNEISICHGISSFRLFIGDYQQPEIAAEGLLCDKGELTLTANAGYSSYLWSTGETTQSITVTEPGIYTVIVEKAYGNKVCDGFAEMEVRASITPTIEKIDTKDWTRDQNEITIYTKEEGQFEYSIDGVNYQAENVFAGLETGVYNVYVKDANGCGQDVQEVVLMHYPNYFTPNGDGVHDKWRIKYSVLEPHLKVSIFDRYGKMITSFGPTDEGWDGTLNGVQLPSTDYWFVVTREDGRELRGHFAMLR
ncbi:T9SS type B sorting domain-containing protein, partial [uncultured Flavobacterium sp.]|uniref:T9SS type B sorting domain-containing protein n=1 Tax=uncultured Flavobacterium sp. TaxID=165435 RepID=UPI0025D35774